VSYKKRDIEITSLRKSTSLDTVKDKLLLEDANSRDFSVNSVYYEPFSGTLFDPTNVFAPCFSSFSDIW